MTRTQTRDLYDLLRDDPWRRANPHSPDIAEAHEVIHREFATKAEIKEVLNLWCESKQPCNFGRIAAKQRAIHFCILTTRDLLRSDNEIRALIDAERRLWKRRAYDDTKAPPHGFLLVVASERVAFAAPDFHLKRFAEHLLGLTGWKPTQRADGQVSSDFLYLQHPAEPFAYGFRFNLDFFAAAGDNRWWHDHRIPGGIAFTANATGHMKAFQELYKAGTDSDRDRGAWFVQQAMYTVAQAHRRNPDPKLSPEQAGAVTWLRDLRNGKPMKEQASPLRDRLPGVLQGKDWTAYEGVLHTDQAIRPEFFDGADSPATAAKPFFMDFTYLYDRDSKDYRQFTGGERVSKEEVYNEIGRPEEWVFKGGDAPTDVAGVEPERSQVVSDRINAGLSACRNWQPPSGYSPLHG